jgi:hypothetical protein
MRGQCNWGDLFFYGLIFLFFILGMIGNIISLSKNINAVKQYGWSTKKFSTEWEPYSAGTMVIISILAGILGGYYFIHKLGLYLLSILDKC